jgi:hypothetical protein
VTTNNKTFYGVLQDAEDGKAVEIEESPSGAMLLRNGKNEIAVWPDHLLTITEKFEEWQNG